MLWFGVHFPLLGLEIFERRYPTEVCSPIVLIDNGHVQIMNDRAGAIGISIGSTLTTAHSIAVNLNYFNRNLKAEQKRLRYLAEAAYRYTSHVSLSEANCLLMEMHASLKLFGGIALLCENLKALFRQLHHGANIAIAHTPGAALAFARAGKSPVFKNFPTDKSIVSNSLNMLRDIPLEYTDLESKDIKRLADMGMFKLGKLLQLPRAELGLRFGQTLQSYLAKLKGDEPDPRPALIPNETFISSVNLIEAISDKQTLLFPMRRLAFELATWLNARQLGIKRLDWRFQSLRDGPYSEFQVSFSNPRFNTKHIFNVSKLKLERISIPNEVMSITLSAIEVMARPIDAFDLFESHGSAPACISKARQSELIEAIEARLGSSALQGLTSVDDHRPEFAWALLPPGTKQLPHEDGKHSERPLWLFDSPYPVNIEYFRLLSGPERIETGWWVDLAEEKVTRDYFIGMHKSGAQCWLYVERKNQNKWFLHGYFA